MLKSLVTMAALVAAMALVPMHAFATISAPLPVTGKAYIGSISGDQWMGVQPWSGGSCSWVKLSSGPLHDHVTISGTSVNDVITVVASQTSACGFTFQPLQYNGFYLTEYGNGGADTIIAGFNSDYAYGGTGNDLVWGDLWDGFLEGDSGNDNLYGHDNPTDYLWGSDGADRLCEHPSSNVGWMDGGPGTDIRCGNSNGANVLNVESINCGACNY
jgi:Ca2+-binding RTX toxin-like protein